MTQLTTPVAVWLVDGRPARLVWDGTRYTVTDTPTPLHDEDDLFQAITHPLPRLIGWRFQASSASGETYVFDVRRGARDQWELVGMYS